MHLGDILAHVTSKVSDQFIFAHAFLFNSFGSLSFNSIDHSGCITESLVSANSMGFGDFSIVGIIIESLSVAPLSLVQVDFGLKDFNLLSLDFKLFLVLLLDLLHHAPLLIVFVFEDSLVRAIKFLV